MAQDQITDPVQKILDPLTGVDKTVKALAWDAYQSGDQQTFQTKLDALNLPKDAKAALWDAKFGQGGGPPQIGQRPQRRAQATPTGNQAPSASELVGDNMLGTGLDALAGFGRGFQKTVQTLASPIRKATGMAPATPPPEESTLSGSIGHATEQVAEFLVPEQVAGKFAKVYNAAQRLKAMGYAPQAARLLGSIPEAVMQAIGAYTTARVQGDTAPKTAAAIGGSLPIIGAAAATVAPRVMKSAIGQVSKDILKKYKTSTQEIANTLMENGANVSKKGLDKLQSVLDISDDQLDKIIKGLKGVIDPKKVAQRTEDVTKTFGEQVNPKEDLDLIEHKTKEFLNHPVHAQQVITGVSQQPTGAIDPSGRAVMKTVPIYTTQTGSLSAAEAQAMKRGTYRQLAGKYTKLGSAGTETEKALARGLREEIEDLAHSQGVHDIEAINKNEAKLMAALEATGERLAKMEKPVDETALMYATRWAARHPISALMSVARSESVTIRSVAARAMSGDVPKLRVANQMVRAALTAIAAGSSGSPAEGETADVSSATRRTASPRSSTRPPIQVTGGLPATPPAGR